MVHSDRVPPNQDLCEENDSKEIVVKSESSLSASTSKALVKPANVFTVKSEIQENFEDEVNHWHSLIIKASKQLVSGL